MNAQATLHKLPADAHPDPVTGEVGSHPVTTGVGAAVAGVAGLAAAAIIGGPASVVAAVIGAPFIGGYAGKALGELIDPTSEEAFWRQEHPHQPYADEETTYEDFEPAYQVGYQGYQRRHDRTFEDAETDLHAHYKLRAAKLPWAKARHASRAAWERAHHHRIRSSAPVHTGVGEAAMNDNSQDGSLGNAQMPR